MQRILQHPYAQLMRVHSLTGAYLLLSPTLLAYVIGSQALRTQDAYFWLVLLTVASFTTRFLGCAINDVWDRDIDSKVERTKNRPLASGKMTLKEALVIIAVLAIFNLSLLFLLTFQTILICLVAALMIVVYPLMKRIIPVPQAFLALVFSMGIPIAWLLADSSVNWQRILPAFLANYFWIMYYDSIYALCDLKDDKKLSIGSMAKFMGNQQQVWLGVFAALSLICWAWLGYQEALGSLWFGMLVVIAGFFSWQIQQSKTRAAQQMIELFHHNGKLGLMMALVAGLCLV